MPRKTWPSLFEAPRDLATDYVLIACGVAAAVLGLLYLVLT